MVGIKSFDISKLWSFLKMYHWYMIIVYMFQSCFAQISKKEIKKGDDHYDLNSHKTNL